jgi:hypothetical protein
MFFVMSMTRLRVRKRNEFIRNGLQINNIISGRISKNGKEKIIYRNYEF